MIGIDVNILVRYAVFATFDKKMYKKADKLNISPQVIFLQIDNK